MLVMAQPGIFCKLSNSPAPLGAKMLEDARHRLNEVRDAAHAFQLVRDTSVKRIEGFPGCIALGQPVPALEHSGPCRSTSSVSATKESLIQSWRGFRGSGQPCM